VSNSPQAATFYENVVEENGKRLAVFRSGAVIGRFNVTGDDFVDQLALVPASPSYGVIVGKFIPRFLESSPTLSTRADVIDGIAVRLIDGTANDIRLQTWLDPQLGYVARRVRAERTAPPELKRVVDFSVKRFEKRGSLFVPKEAATTFVYPRRPGLSAIAEEAVVNGQRVLRQTVAKDSKGNVIMLPESRGILEIKLSEVDFAPTFTDADFRLKQHIADGTRVTMEDARQLQYAWQNGTVTPVAAHGAAASAATATFLQKGRGPSVVAWVIIVNIVFLGTALLVYVYRRRQS
jgi:hypothetical protein